MHSEFSSDALFRLKAEEVPTGMPPALHPSYSFGHYYCLEFR